MSKSLTRLAAIAGLSVVAQAVLAAGGGPMSSGPAVGGVEARESSPQEKAKSAYNAGIKSIKKARELDADAASAATPEKKAKAAEKAGKAYNKALDQFNEAVSNQPDLAEAWNYIGFANRHLGAYAESLDAYNKALSLNPRYFEAIEYRAEAYLGLNRIEDAKTAYMDLFREARPLSDQLLQAMQSWAVQRRQDAKGLESSQLDAFEQWLNERAGVAKPTPRDHRHIKPTGRQHGRQHQRKIIADAAGGMLVDHGTGQVPIQDGSRVSHREGETHGFIPRHALEEHGHGESRDLPF